MFSIQHPAYTAVRIFHVISIFVIGYLSLRRVCCLITNVQYLRQYSLDRHVARLDLEASAVNRTNYSWRNPVCVQVITTAKPGS